MKEIGERLKEARENMEISIEEAAEDLKLDPQILENLELGNKQAFKDVLYLKFYIKDYSKYLGLNYDEMVEEFNEYLFDYTSKISLDDIKNANKGQKQVKKEISSPYTLERKQPPKEERKKTSMTKKLMVFLLVVQLLKYLQCMLSSKV